MEGIFNWFQSILDAVHAGGCSFGTEVLIPFWESLGIWISSHMAWFANGVKNIYAFFYELIRLKFRIRVASYTFLVFVTVGILVCCVVFRIFHKKYSRRRK